MFYSDVYNSPVGKITIACDEAGKSLVGLWIDGQSCGEYIKKEGMTEKSGIPVLNKTKKWLGSYFAGEKPCISELPLSPLGSEFRQTVWGLLCEIPYGETVSYGELAKRTARLLNKEKMSAQAIGGAVGHNPISIIIPCHRVIGADGSMTGYGGGIDIKIKLLGHEGMRKK